MVKNFKGGNKAKGQGRKFSYNTPSPLRLSNSPFEVYACVTKHFGQGRCSVTTVDHQVLQCIIRHKFKKRNSNILIGSIILIGLREWEGPDNFKNSDLLELYDHNDHSLLKSIPNTRITNLDQYIEPHNTNTNTNSFQFSNIHDDHNLNFLHI